MKLVFVKCYVCGGTLQVDFEKEAVVCEFCKQPFIVEKTITNYNTKMIHKYNQKSDEMFKTFYKPKGYYTKEVKCKPLVNKI